MANIDDKWLEKRMQQIPEFIDTGNEVKFTKQETENNRNKLIELMKESGVDVD